MSDSDFLVVFEYTAEAGAYAGNRFITPFKDEADYEIACTDEWLQERQLQVVQSGILQAEAAKLCDEVGFGPKLVATAFEYGDNPEIAVIMLAAQLKL